jgi:hypothetical protein
MNINKIKGYLKRYLLCYLGTIVVVIAFCLIGSFMVGDVEVPTVVVSSFAFYRVAVIVAVIVTLGSYIHLDDF